MTIRKAQDRSYPWPGGRTATIVRAMAFGAVCAAAAVATAHADESGLSLSDGWVRSIMASRPAAGYFTLRNDGDKPHKLVAASSPGCGMLMIHRSKNENGIDKMAMVDSVDVPPHQSVSFAPGGYHLMCMKPTEAVKPGKSVSITLTFDDGGTMTADFPVKSATGK
jgi:copper(I)-binding protein